jgi:predicted RNA-binding Zn-ribbon protein involved in translation (DUF1610 family)
LEKILSLLTRISELYAIPQWIVNSGAIAICVILISFPFIARVLMRPKYHKFRELILFKVLWRWKYKKGDVIGLWCYCPKCQNMLMVDDENCRSEETLQHKITYFVCPECGGHELGRVIGGDRRYVLSLVRRDIWRHIRDGSYNEVATATKEALDIYAKLEEEKTEEKAEVLASLEEKVEHLEGSIEEVSEENNDTPSPETEDVTMTHHQLSETTNSTHEHHFSQEERSTEELQTVVDEDEKEIKKDGV